MTTLLGIDLGYGSIKLASQTNTTQTPSFVSIPTGDRIGPMAGVKRTRAATLIQWGDRAFYCGANAHSDGRPLENLDYDRLLGSPEITALLYAALTEHGLGNGETIACMFGLPMELVKEDERDANIAAVKEWATGDHTWTANGVEYSVTVEQANATTQAAGALFDYLFDEHGKPGPNASKAKGEIGIVSVGFNTIELMAMKARKPVQRLTGSTTNGVRRLFRLADPRQSYTLGELDELHRAGGLDTSDAKPLWAREVHGDIENVWGKAWQRFGVMLWVGGGSVIMNGARGRYEAKAHDPADPVMSIASGLLKSLLASEARKAARNG